MKKLIAILCLLAGGVFADTHYVSLNGTNNSPYLNWADASTNVQWAVDAAVAGDTVMISNGTYYLTNQIDVAQDSITLKGVDDNYNSVLLVGCPYAGQTEGVTSRVMYVTGAGASISGLTFTNGQTTSVSGSGVGAALWCIGASLTLSNCFISGNISVAGAYNGVAVFINNASEHLIHSCIISDNKETGASGNASALQLAAGKLTVTNTVITRNKSLGYSSTASTTSIFDNCVISTNGTRGAVTLAGLSRWTGCAINANTNTANCAGFILNHPDTIISNCLILGNRGPNSGLGAGVLVNAAAAGSTIANSYIYDNHSSAGAGSGNGIYLAGKANVSSCIFSNNSSVSGTGNGGALYVITSNSVVQNCLFINNGQAAQGGAIYVHAASTNTLFYNCTIVSNKAGANGGGGVYLNNATNSFYNCLVYSNKVASGVGADILNNVDGTTPYNYCLSSSNLSSFGTGNITNQPTFVDFASANFRLSAGSAGIDAGTNSIWTATSLDLDGLARISPIGGIVDIGCYEYQWPVVATVFRFGGYLVTNVPHTYTTRYTDNGDGTVTDTNTWLMWVADGSTAGELVWTNAIAYCSNLVFAGHTDWRLPTANSSELDTLGWAGGIYGGTWEMGDGEGWTNTPFINVGVGSYRHFWSLTENGETRAYYVDLLNGTKPDGEKSTPYWVLPVRGPIPPNTIAITGSYYRIVGTGVSNMRGRAQ